MNQRRRPSREWYRRKISDTGDMNFQAGPSPHIEGAEQSKPPLTVAFGTLLRLERRSKRLSIPRLAQELDVDIEELTRIEAHDASFKARPRTILSIAKHFQLPAKELMKLAGAAVSNDERFEEKALKFAAHSDDFEDLSKEERQLLNEFVTFLKNKD